MFQMIRGKNKGSEIDFGNCSEWGTVEKEIHPERGGRISYQASSWKAKEVNGQRVCEGETVFVIKRVGSYQLVERCA